MLFGFGNCSGASQGVLAYTRCCRGLSDFIRVQGFRVIASMSIPQAPDPEGSSFTPGYNRQFSNRGISLLYRCWNKEQDDRKQQLRPAKPMSASNRESEVLPAPSSGMLLIFGINESMAYGYLHVKQQKQ